MVDVFRSLGFIGLGVMGEPMCRNMATKTALSMHVYDRDPLPMQRLSLYGVKPASSIRVLAEASDIVFLSLPSGEVVSDVCLGDQGLLASARPGWVVVDLSTSPVDLTRDLAAQFASKGSTFIDAPVARTREAAEAGTLSIMVGAEAPDYERVKPLLQTFASDLTLCGGVGTGQVVKILNNMVLFETVVALAEAKAIAERAGVDPALLFNALSKGSADSFALRNHGMKAMLPGKFPERAFSVEYARKDLAYALRLASETGVDARGAHTVDAWFSKAIKAGEGGQYHPVISRRISESQSKAAQGDL
jgi:3-hydroxyisobutyrate dehydrogenase-like beta-hydroxyacid dehydrogenase